MQNFIDKAVYNRLIYKHYICDTGDVRVIGGNGKALDLKGFAVLPVFLGSTLVWHKFKLVPNFLFEVLIRANLLTLYVCSLVYLKNN